MPLVNLDTKGLKCPQPTLKIAVMAARMKAGDVLDVVANCPTFEKDVREWCQRTKKILLWLREEGGGVKHCQIQF